MKFSLAAGILYSRQGCDFGEFKGSYGLPRALPLRLVSSPASC